MLHSFLLHQLVLSPLLGEVEDVLGEWVLIRQLVHLEIVYEIIGVFLASQFEAVCNFRYVDQLSLHLAPYFVDIRGRSSALAVLGR